MLVKCTAYVWPDGTVMVHGDSKVDHLDRWIHPDEKAKARKVKVAFEFNGFEKKVMGRVVNQ